MASYQCGDLAAFEELFDRYRKQLFTFLLHQAGERGAAEDLFQDVFLKLIRNAEQFDARRSFRAWVYTIARNATTDRHRKQGVRASEVLENAMVDDTNTVGLDGLSRDAAKAADPASVAQAKDLRRQVEGALLKLPDNQREVFLLRERAKLDYERIAELTGCGIATAKSRMRYALVALRRHLSETGLDATPAAEGSHD